MWFIGIHNTQLNKEKITTPCQHCGEENCVQLHLLQAYVHIFGIPFFPLRKNTISICTHCKKITRSAEMTTTNQDFAKSLKSGGHTPWWTVSGSILTIGLVGFLWYSISTTQNQYATMISQAVPGDLYTIKISDSRYSLYKVNRVHADTIFVFYSQTEASKSKYTRFILERGKDAFESIEHPYLKKDLLQKLKQRQLLSVSRP